MRLLAGRNEVEGNSHVGLFTSPEGAGCKVYTAMYYHLGQYVNQDYFVLVKEYRTMSAAQAAANKLNKGVKV